MIYPGLTWPNPAPPHDNCTSLKPTLCKEPPGIISSVSVETSSTTTNHYTNIRTQINIYSKNIILALESCIFIFTSVNLARTRALFAVSRFLSRNSLVFEISKYLAKILENRTNIDRLIYIYFLNIIIHKFNGIGSIYIVQNAHLLRNTCIAYA